MERKPTKRKTQCLTGRQQIIPRGISEFGENAPRFHGYRVAVNSKSNGIWIGQVYFSVARHGSYDNAFLAAVAYMESLKHQQ